MSQTLFIAQAVISMVICFHMAKRYQANPIIWGVLGLIFGPMAIIAMFIIDPRAVGGNKTEKDQN